MLKSNLFVADVAHARHQERAWSDSTRADPAISYQRNELRLGHTRPGCSNCPRITWFALVGVMQPVLPIGSAA